MKYLLLTLITIFSISAQARLTCKATCKLTGPNVEESQLIYYFDGSFRKAFVIENLNERRIVGGFVIDGDSNSNCDYLTSVWISIDGHLAESKAGDSLNFRLDDKFYNFTCDYHGSN